MSLPLRGLYVITDAHLQAPERLAERVEAALRGGARVVQYRDKGDDGARRLREAQTLRRLCRGRALFIVNDDVGLAAEVEADGVHLGEDDAALTAARRTLGADARIGVSCYNQLALAHAAVAAGADYVAFGSVFPSPTKPQARRADLELLQRARAELAVPVVAIGGIDADNAGAVIKAGANALAVISAVFGQPDPEAAAHRIARLFD